jgi:hypothetical protein
MQNVRKIYQQSVLPLPNREKLQLATIILQDLSSSERSYQSSLDLLQNLPDDRVFVSSTEVDEHMKSERESWDN